MTRERIDGVLRRGFTLLELLAVVAIMGVMGTLSISAYRGLQRGMEERGALEAARHFVRNAYMRAQIDRVPVTVYFWNETLRGEESDDENAVVCGRAVAVRRAGRITHVSGQYLFDEFGDLVNIRVTDDEGNTDDGDSSYKQDVGMYLYPANGNESTLNRSRVSQMSAGDTENVKFFGDGTDHDIDMYAYFVLDPGSVTWKAGDAYGMEFAELTLPNGFIFGTDYSKSSSQTIRTVKSILFKTSGAGGSETIELSALRQDENGSIVAKSIGKTEPPNSNL